MWEPRKPTTAFPRTVSVPQQATARFGSATSIKGQIQSREDLYIDGDFQGTLDIEGYRLTVGPHARVEASAQAREVIVLGTMIGDIRTSGVVIDDGAYFKGKIDIITPLKIAAAGD